MAGESVRRNTPLTSLLASSASAAVQKAAERTAENKAIRRYRMIATPKSEAGSPAVEMAFPGGTGAGRCYRFGVVLCRPRPGINTFPRHFFGGMSQAGT